MVLRGAYPSGRLVRLQRGAERSLREQQLGGGAALCVVLHLFLEMADKH